MKLAFLFSHSKPFLCCALGRRVWEKQKDTARRLRDAVVQLRCEWTNEFKIKAKLKVKTTLYYKEYRPQNTATIREKVGQKLEKNEKKKREYVYLDIHIENISQMIVIFIHHLLYTYEVSEKSVVCQWLLSKWAFNLVSIQKDMEHTFLHTRVDSRHAFCPVSYVNQNRTKLTSENCKHT